MHILQNLRFFGLCTIATCSIGCIDLVASESNRIEQPIELQVNDIIEISQEIGKDDVVYGKSSDCSEQKPISSSGSLTVRVIAEYGVPVVKTILVTGLSYCAQETLSILLNKWAQNKPLNQATQLVANLAKAASEAEAAIIQQKLLEAFAKISTIKNSDIATLQKICSKIEKCKYKDENLCQITRKKYMALLEQSENRPSELQNLKKKSVNTETITQLKNVKS